MPVDRHRLAELGATLRRVKAGERVESDGGKKVWHQGEKGVEVVSHVTPQGRVTRQEIYFDPWTVIWSAGNPIITGRVPAEPRHRGVSRSLEVVADSEPQVEAVEWAMGILLGVKAEDRYLSHMLVELQSAKAGLEAGLEKSVTSMRSVLASPPVTASFERPRSPWRWAWPIAAALVVGLGWWWFGHRGPG